MDAHPQRPRRRRWLVWSAAAAMALAGLVLAALAWADHYLRTGLRDHAVTLLEQRLEGKVQLASLEDLLRLAVSDSTPLMTGRLDMNSSFELPPGPQDVVERLALKGRFSLQGVRLREGGRAREKRRGSRRAC